MQNIYILIFLIFFSCKKNDRRPSSSSGFAYQLDKPDEIYFMPDSLKEISGIQYKNETILACIEDNHGIIYLYNLINKELVEKIVFVSKGDFEDLAIVKDNYYALRSDGDIYSITNKNQPIDFNSKLRKGSDSEGLCFDSKNNRLLIACKEVEESNLSKHKKAIYSFSLIENKISERPVILIDLKKLEQKDYTRHIMNFSPSGIAINPITGNLFIISAKGNILIETNDKGEVLFVKELPEKLFPQPEGICFSPVGDLMISNEGKEGSGSILRFKIN